MEGKRRRIRQIDENKDLKKVLDEATKGPRIVPLMDLFSLAIFTATGHRHIIDVLGDSDADGDVANAGVADVAGPTY
ncbi:uncharacterized protein Bfra_007842 [Botrytis fragariae]|uniref:Uncharacterized protein n=1 Tax=Botrytis fragariae TaxID=1964551 RepID=A0A8H6APT6_9HELO|nr:uncharacterized protein Bfra_007842 [Botrytis fragariae]KAF5871326.1 hypothetical protein Bfra_007842 [Botrytis fragariae]